MAPIKSALEIAMENSKGIEANKELLEATRFKEEGKKLVFRLFDEPTVDLKEALKAFDKKQAAWVKEGLIQSLLANLVLPVDEIALKRNRTIGAAVTASVSDTKRIGTMFSQLEHFFKEFMDERNRLMDAVQRQYGPKLKKKEEEISKQMGRPVKINPASDPEFQAIVRQYLSQLDDKYEQVLAGAKEEIKTLFLKG